ncbi:MAG: hypothetical protein KGY38_04310 [Desulfobacterales bacterium]|nr:hypothetical protein [Desulfobacterales bacterium]
MDPRMQPGKPLRELIDLKSNNEELKNIWDKFLKLLQENVSAQKLEFSETHFPEIKQSDQSGYRFHCFFTEIPIFCEFRQWYNWGIMRIGFQKKNEEGKYIDQIKEVAYFDFRGNIHKNIDEDPEGTNIAMKSHFSEAIFPRMLRALEASMKELEGAPKTR